MINWLRLLGDALIAAIRQRPRRSDATGRVQPGSRPGPTVKGWRGAVTPLLVFVILGVQVAAGSPWQTADVVLLLFLILVALGDIVKVLRAIQAEPLAAADHQVWVWPLKATDEDPPDPDERRS